MIDPIEVARAAVTGRLRRFPQAYALARRLAGRTIEDKDQSGYVEAVYRTFAPLCTGGNTLEIGPGSNLGASLLLARDGCRATAIDLVDLRSPGLDDLYAQALTATPRLTAAEAARRNGDAAAAPMVRYLRASIEQLPFGPATFDFIFSNACFEHFRNPMKAVAEIGRVLRPGGRTAHQIDLRDHRDFNRPLRFLRYGDRTWALMNPSGPAYQNRWRLSWYVRTFEQCGFRVEVTINLRATAAQLDDLGCAAPRFRHLTGDDASALGCLLVAEKPVRPAVVGAGTLVLSATDTL